MPFAPPLVTRDLAHFRKLPARQTALSSVADAFFALLASADHPLAPAVRAVFLPALLGRDATLRDGAGGPDEVLRRLFVEQPPHVVLLQTIPSAEAVDAAWRAEPTAMAARVFVAYTLHTELERAKGEDEKEEMANLSMMVIATLAYELAQWVWVKTRGYHPADAMSDTSSLYAATTGHSASSNSSSGSLPAVHRSKDDVGTRAVLALVGCEYELLAYAIGSRELVKRRYPTRRSAALQPAGVYFLIGDTPAIRDCTGAPATASGIIPPHCAGDSMYTVTSVLTPAGLARMHGCCALGQTQGVIVSLDGAADDSDDEAGEEKGFNSIYTGA
ncbi:hypothetical protein JCM3770_005107 [Rhodotorula araucariae]